MRNGTIRWALPAAALVLLIIAAAFAGLRYRQTSTDHAREQAIQAARQVLINAYTMNYQNVDADYARFIAGTTGTLHSQLEEGKSKFVSTAKQTQTKETATVAAAGLVRFDSDTATVAVALDSPMTSKTVKTSQTRRYRTEVDVKHEHGQWLATAIRQVD